MNTYSCAPVRLVVPRLLARLRLDPVRRVPRVVPRVLEVDRVLLLGELPLAGRGVDEGALLAALEARPRHTDVVLVGRSSSRTDNMSSCLRASLMAGLFEGF